MILALGARRPSIPTVAGTELAHIGLLPSDQPENEILTLLCAFCFAGHILGVDHFTRRVDQRLLPFLQVISIRVLPAVPAFFVEHLLLNNSRFMPTPRLLLASAVTPDQENPHDGISYHCGIMT